MSKPPHTEPAAQTPPPPAHEANGRFAKGNRGGPGHPFSCQALVNALNDSDTSEGAKPVWAPPSINGFFGELPPRIRQLARALFELEEPSPNGNLPSLNGELPPPEQTAGD